MKGSIYYNKYYFQVCGDMHFLGNDGPYNECNSTLGCPTVSQAACLIEIGAIGLADGCGLRKITLSNAFEDSSVCERQSNFW